MATQPINVVGAPRQSSRDEDPIIYHSFSGTDILAELIIPNERHPMVLGELSTISYSIHRENKPVRALGKVNVRGFVRGSRTIAGSMIFTQFNKYAFYRLFQYKELVYGTLLRNKQMYPLADMLPPFDIVLTFANEYGSFSRMKIMGMVIVDEGGTFSIENIVSEQEFTYMASGIIPMTDYIPDHLKPRYNQPSVRANSANRPNSIDSIDSNFGTQPA